MSQVAGGRPIPRALGRIRKVIRAFVEDAGPSTWHIRDFYDLFPGTRHSSVRTGLYREVDAGVLLRPAGRRGLFQSTASPPLWDPLTRYENLRVTGEVGSRGSSRVPLLARLNARFGAVLEDETNRGYHFAGAFELLQRSRAITLSVYPTKLHVSLGSHDDPLRFWELFIFLTCWLPEVTGFPVPAWVLTQVELNRDHLIAGGETPRWVETRTIPLTQAVAAMVKVYTKHELQAVRAEVRLSGAMVTDVLMDDVRAMLEWAERIA